MSKPGLDLFLKNLPTDPALAASVADAIAQAAKAAGYDVTAQDARQHFVDQPKSRPLPPPDYGRVTTQAVGEESRRPSVTQAIGEDDRPPMTTQAVGEEDGGWPPNRRASVTCAIGEEDKPANKPKP